MRTVHADASGARAAAEALAAGGVVVVPTDTVYGLAARPDDASAVQAVFRAKGRPEGMHLPVLAASEEQVRALGVAFTPAAVALARSWWPGPLTLALGFDAVCTGHYARIVDGVLHRAADPGKDQSYVLAVLTSDQLSHAMFPLGDTPKAQVRAEASGRGLAVADKPDSHDVCFIADGDTNGFLAKHLGAAPGQIVDSAGVVLGEHQGAYGFTIGQRKGLRVGTPADDGKPRYVLDIEPATRTVTVGSAEELDVTEITAERPVWTGCTSPEEPFDALVQLRAHGEVHPGTAWLDGDALRIRLHRPARGVAKGQAAVLYDGEAVLGSATISATSGAARHAPVSSTTA